MMERGFALNNSTGNSTYLRTFNGLELGATRGYYFGEDVKITRIRWDMDASYSTGEWSIRRDDTEIDHVDFGSGDLQGDEAINMDFDGGGTLTVRAVDTGTGNIQNPNVYLECYRRLPATVTVAPSFDVSPAVYTGNATVGVQHVRNFSGNVSGSPMGTFSITSGPGAITSAGQYTYTPGSVPSPAVVAVVIRYTNNVGSPGYVEATYNLTVADQPAASTFTMPYTSALSYGAGVYTQSHRDKWPFFNHLVVSFWENYTKDGLRAADMLKEAYDAATTGQYAHPYEITQHDNVNEADIRDNVISNQSHQDFYRAKLVSKNYWVVVRATKYTVARLDKVSNRVKVTTNQSLPSAFVDGYGVYLYDSNTDYRIAGEIQNRNGNEFELQIFADEVGSFPSSVTATSNMWVAALATNTNNRDGRAWVNVTDWAADASLAKRLERSRAGGNS